MNVSTGPRAYPLRLLGTADPRQRRWSWLYKWILSFPHVVVLAVLWLAVAAVTLAAGIVVLFTGRYPRPMFDFVVGVLRWSWRVSFYAFGPVGTDVYPPFSHDHVPDFPADLDVEYPVRLSRGLVLVKWWLLIIPQAMVVAVLSGGWGPAHFGLISLLALVAVVGRAFNGRYPDGLFQLIVGLQRWCYRVMAYGLLLTDAYPPFRLDLSEIETTPAAARLRRPLPVQ
jgi:hypothetical protein